MKDVFEAMEKINTATLQLVAPSYYLLMRKLQPKPSESRTTSLFRAKLRKYLDEKYWTSINALHWIACFLDPSFKHLQFIPSRKRDDAKFKHALIEDLDAWVLDETSRGGSDHTQRQQQRLPVTTPATTGTFFTTTNCLNSINHG